MTDLKSTINKELAELTQLRDELRVKAHLAKADAKDAMARLESRWPELQRELKAMEKTSANILEDAGKNILAAAKDMRDEYQRLLKG
ncbi:MAG: hypothetical protein IPG45_25660 [Deltaproteobacteria bacterium]|nr:hypothetical protein [Deltaproteobacteria bacterium]